MDSGPGPEFVPAGGLFLWRDRKPDDNRRAGLLDLQA
jgi:hypothetical protein